MEGIPISFEHAGKKYRGHFSQVSGAGDSSVWHLMDDKNYYLGQLRYTNGWVFDPTPKTNKLVELADFFGDYVTAWIQ